MGCIKAKPNLILNQIEPKATEKKDDAKKAEEIKKAEPEIKKNSKD